MIRWGFFVSGGPEDMGSGGEWSVRVGGVLRRG